MASWVTLRLTLPDTAVPLIAALPTEAVETVALWVLKSVEVSAWSWVLSWPRLVPSAPMVLLWVDRFVSVVWRLVIGMLSAAMIDEMIDETLRPLNVPPIVTPITLLPDLSV